MSNYLAIATVTATLKNILDSFLKNEISDIDFDVTTRRPDEAGNQPPDKARVNIYLYQVTPNIAYRNEDLPTRRPDAQLVQRPRVALELHYLLTLYDANEAKLEAQRLLGSVVSTLHTHPVLTREDIRKIFQQQEYNFLAESDLAEEIELVKFTPMSVSLEELSKLWSVFFQVPYALSVTYQASLVLIEKKVSTRPTLPVLQRNIFVRQFRNPVIERIISKEEFDDRETINDPITVNSTLVILGLNFRSERTQVRIAGEVENPQEITDTQIILDLKTLQQPDRLRAGIQPVQVLHRILDENNNPLEFSFESNVAAFALRPSFSVNGISFDQNTNTVAINNTAPKVDTTQRVVLLLNEVVTPPERPSNSYSFDAESREVDTDPIKFIIKNVEQGNYFVRVQIDGAESPLGPKFVIGPGTTPSKLRVTDIGLAFTGDSPPFTITGRVTVEDENASKIAGASVSAKWSVPQGRVDDGLIALYNFLEGEGTQIRDVSGVGDAIDLEISDPSKADWLAGGGLHFKVTGVKAQSDAAAKLFQRLTASNQLTVEAWVTAENLTQDGPARMISYSGGRAQRNFTLAQDQRDLVMRLRTPTSGENGIDAPLPLIVNDVLETELLHLVSTFDGSTLKVYTNGILRQTIGLQDDFRNWDETHSFVLANEVTNDRQWLGKVFLTAVYESALSEAEVQQNFTAGRPGAEAAGEQQIISETTDNDGIAAFSTSSGEGTYTLQIINVEKSGFAFDGENSETSKSIPVSSSSVSSASLISTPEALEPIGSRDIKISAEQREGIITLLADVAVHDESGKKVDDAAVSATWTLPDGTTREQSENTGKNGVARFSTTNGDGSYVLKITNIIKSGYEFDSSSGETEQKYTV